MTRARMNQRHLGLDCAPAHFILKSELRHKTLTRCGKQHKQDHK